MEIFSSRILENTPGQSIIQTLGEQLGGARSVRMAVGYLYVEGLLPLVPAIAKMERAELLIGNVMNKLPEDRIQEEQSARITASVAGDKEGFARAMRDKRNRLTTVTALNLRKTIEELPQTEQVDSGVAQLARLIAEGKLQVRVYSAGRLHAKLTIAGYPAEHRLAPGFAIVGSTNITIPLNRIASEANCDLDIIIDGDDNFSRLNRWFERYWNDAQDFRKELFEELARRWPSEAIQL